MNPDHILAKRESITFEEINGYNFLMLSRVGYWYEICKDFLDMSKFLIQENRDTFNILIQTTDIPSFRTNPTIPYYKERENKVYIPISSPEAILNFYGIYKKVTNDKSFVTPKNN